jgi:hypothetical protein
MNGFPTAEQKRFHDDLRDIGCIVTGAMVVEIHHIFGSKWKAKGFNKPGEWLVIPLHRKTHAEINSYSFESERALFLASLRKYKLIFGKDAPVPEMLIEYYKAMKHRNDITKGLPIN